MPCTIVQCVQHATGSGVVVHAAGSGTYCSGAVVWCGCGHCRWSACMCCVLQRAWVQLHVTAAQQQLRCSQPCPPPHIHRSLPRMCQAMVRRWGGDVFDDAGDLKDTDAGNTERKKLTAMLAAFIPYARRFQ